MRVTLAQTAPRLNRSNLQEIIDIVLQEREKSDIIVFPELSLSGYLLQDKLHEDAWTLEELEPLIALSEDVDIVVGAALRDENVFRNTALYLHKKRVVAKHIKVHLPNYGMFEEARYFEGGDGFEAFMVDDKKISLLVCEDLWHSSVHEQLIALDPDLIIVLVASPARGFNDKGLAIEEKWYAIIQTIAKECRAKLVFVNRVGFEDGLGFWGGSCLVDSRGSIVNKLPKFEKIVQTVQTEG
jgi:predicted amidohydrolase